MSLNPPGGGERPPQLPKRDIPALIEALRIRALALCGEKWERDATRDMMKEAADRLEEMLSAGGDLQAIQCKAHHPLYQQRCELERNHAEPHDSGEFKWEVVEPAGGDGRAPSAPLFKGHIDPDCEVVRGVGWMCTCETATEKAERQQEREESEREQPASEELAKIRALCVEAGMEEPSTIYGYVRTVFWRLHRELSLQKQREDGGMADAAALNPADASHAGSSPAPRTTPASVPEALPPLTKYYMRDGTGFSARGKPDHLIGGHDFYKVADVDARDRARDAREEALHAQANQQIEAACERTRLVLDAKDQWMERAITVEAREAVLRQQLHELQTTIVGSDTPPWEPHALKTLAEAHRSDSLDRDAVEGGSRG